MDRAQFTVLFLDFVQQALDDDHGISHQAHGVLMELYAEWKKAPTEGFATFESMLAQLESTEGRWYVPTRVP